MIKKGDILTLEDDNQYTVVDMFVEEEKTYAFLVDINDTVNFIYCKIEDDGLVDLAGTADLEHVIKVINDRLHNA